MPRQVNIDPDKEKLIIEVDEEGQAPAEETPAEELGLLPTPYFKRHTYRRPRKETEFIDPNRYVRIMDGGVLASGDDIDWIFNSPPELIIIPNSNPSLPPTYKRYELATPPYVPSYNAYMVGKTPDDFQEINPADSHKYGHATTVLGAYEPGKGYVFTSTQFSSSGGAAFRRFDTNNTTQFKITDTPDFAGAEVPFEVTENIDVVLMPIPYRFSGDAYVRELVAFSTPGWSYPLCGYYGILKRSFCLDNPTYAALFNPNGMYRSTVQDNNPDAPHRPLPQRDFFYNWFTTMPEASLYKVYSFLSFFARWYISHTVEPPGTFPRISTPLVYHDDAVGIPHPLVYCIDAGFNQGVLLAMIRQAGVIYYVWSRNTYPSYSVSVRFKVRV